MDKVVSTIEKAIMYTLIAVGMLFIVYQTIDLLYEFYRIMRITLESGEFFAAGQGRPVGGIFFNILLTMEVVETVRVFNKDHKSKIRIILLVGLIAVTRKILLLDVTRNTAPALEISTSIMLVALGIGYFLVSRAENAEKEDKKI